MIDVDGGRVLKLLRADVGVHFSVREVSKRLGTTNREKVSGVLIGLAVAGLIEFDDVNKLYHYEKSK